MRRWRRMVAQWGLLAAGLLAGGGLALHEHQGRVALLPPPIPSYSVTYVLDGLHSHPNAWIGQTVWVHGLWFDTCGYHSDLLSLSKPGAIGGPGSLCVLASPGQPYYRLADTLIGGTTPGGTFLAITNAPATLPGWQFGGPLDLDRGVAACYRVRLFVESPCTLNDGGVYQPGGSVPPGARPCAVGDVVEARL